MTEVAESSDAPHAKSSIKSTCSIGWKTTTTSKGAPQVVDISLHLEFRSFDVQTKSSSDTKEADQASPKSKVRVTVPILNFGGNFVRLSRIG